MRRFINKIKYRWKHAPIKVKVLDITCWLVLLSLIVYFN